ncbi:MAG: hypothetical protein Q8M24_10205 [Pseudolabrys sp.]|nr:hypothetical protein [Pseudolabrys sp.]MDP2295819.1 hypothetical protein [Pseudolabrys sp.]
MRSVGRKLIACVAALAACAVAFPGRAGAQDSNAAATLARAATLTISRPDDPARVFLDLWVNAYTPPSRGAVEAVVSVGADRGNAFVEVGRFSVFPSEPFTASDARKHRAYRFNATAALAALKPGEETLNVRIDMVSLIEAIRAEGARLEIGKATFSARP